MYFLIKSTICLMAVINLVSTHISEKQSDQNFNSMLSDLEQFKPVEILNGLSVQVEKTQIPAPSSSTSYETTSPNHQNTELNETGRMFGVSDYLTSHALKLDFGLMKLRFGRSDEEPDKMELALYMPEIHNGRSRDRKSAKILLPMILGFKAASTLVVAIASVALLTFKALLAAKLALLVTGVFALKKMLEHKVVVKSSGQHASNYLMPGYNLDMASEAAAAYSHGTTAYADAYANYGLSGQEAASSDLSGQFSSGQAAYDAVAQNTSVSSAAVAAAAKRRDNIRRRPTQPFVPKSHPVYNYRKDLRAS